MSKGLSHIHCLLQHDHTEWNPWYPADKTDNGKDAEDGEHDSSRIIVLYEVVYRCSNTKDDVEYSRDPDELLCECSGESEISPGEDQCDDEDEYEEDDGVGVEGEIIAGIVDSSSIETFVRTISFERETRDGNETEEGQDKLVHVSGQTSVRAHSEEVNVRVYQPTSHCISACQA